MSALRYYITLVIMAVVSLIATAQSVTIEAPATVIQGNRFSVTISVNNSDAVVRNAPEIPNCKIFNASRPGVSTMQSTTIINGRVESSIQRQYTYLYKAEKASTVTIPAVSVGNMRTQAKRLTILPPDRSSQQSQSGSSSMPAPAASAPRAGKVSPGDLIVTVNMSKKHLWKGEAVIATIKVYTKHNITSFRATTLPQFDGFISEELPVGSNEAQMEHFRGENYYSAVLKKCLLYPQKAGTLTINSGRYDVTLETYEPISNGFFITYRPIEQKITTTSNRISVSVEDLPQPAPDGFDGAVGHFTATTDIAPAHPRTNEALTYTLNINGTGNIKSLSAPALSFPANVEEYTPEVVSDANFNGSDMRGTCAVTYTIVPKEVGTLNIPSWNFVYFDPAAGRYMTIKQKGYNLSVIRGSASSAEQKELGEGLKDIRYIHRIDTASLAQKPQRTFYETFYTLLYILVLVAFVSTIIVYRKHIRAADDLAARRTARANKVATKRLRLAAKALAANDADAFHESLARALWGYISDKLRIPHSALTRDNIREKLLESGINEDLTGRTINILDQCEMARFTPDSSSPEHLKGLFDESSAVIKAVESTKKQSTKASAKA